MATSYLCPNLSAASNTTATPSTKYSLPCLCCCLAFWCSSHPSDDYSLSSVDISSSAIPQMCVPVRICHTLPYLSTCTVPCIFSSSPMASKLHTNDFQVDHLKSRSPFRDIVCN